METMKKQAIIATAILGLAMTMPAMAAKGDANAGKGKSTVCAACHGADGNSPTSAFPKLAGQNDDYLANALKAYKNKTRTNAIMNGQAAGLSDQDIADLSAFYASQKGLTYKR
jgi:cytochrome c553